MTGDERNAIVPAGDAAAVIDAVRGTLPPIRLDTSEVYLVTDADGERRVVDTDAWGWSPRRVVRTVVVEDAASLLSYLHQQNVSDRGPEVWADRASFEVRAVLDPPASAEDPGWCDHQAVLRLRPTPEWQTWMAGSGKLGGQQDFAELLEDRAADVVTPAAAHMLELAQSFHATNRVSFESSSFLADGQRGLEYREQVEAKAGRTGKLVIPATFELGLRPFEGGPPYKVTARLRYRIDDGRLRIGYKLLDPEAVARAAFGDVVDEVHAGLDVAWQPIRWGWPKR
jgi:uncharacterized protein YfdQ (DUF2303 family)